MFTRIPRLFLKSGSLRQIGSKVDSLLTTPLQDFHIAYGGKMVPYAGWNMPSVYEGFSIGQSVEHTRNFLSMFDVSHMLQIEVSGNNAEQFLESIMVSDLKALQKGNGTLTLITNDDGGIVDDCIITKIDSKRFYIVANAACTDKVKGYLTAKLDKESSDVIISTLSDRALIALQGPKLTSVVKDCIKEDISKLYFMKSAVMNVYGIEGCRVTRCGYTGEDGIEISVPTSRVIELCEKFLTKDSVKLAGLGCRDILRTEAGLCLYGNEISEDISPVEAGLAWCIGKRRRRDGGFCGYKQILSHLYDDTVIKKRIGLTSHGPILRQHCKVMDEKNIHIGNITSGCPSPTLGCNIAMAYVPKHLDINESELKVQVRNRVITAKVTKLPFIPCTYYHSR